MVSTKSSITIQQMLTKLNDMYDKEDALVKEIQKLIKLYNQVQEDKELLQTIIMHQSNKRAR